MQHDRQQVRQQAGQQAGQQASNTLVPPSAGRTNMPPMPSHINMPAPQLYAPAPPHSTTPPPQQNIARPIAGQAIQQSPAMSPLPVAQNTLRRQNVSAVPAQNSVPKTPDPTPPAPPIPAMAQTPLQNQQSPLHAPLQSGLSPQSGAMSAPLQSVANRDQHRNADRQSTKFMILATIAFLIFYVLTASSKLYRDYSQNSRNAITDHLNHSQNVAAQVAANIDNTIIWINNGLTEGKTPLQSARLISKSPFVRATAILDDNHKIIAASGQNADKLTSVSIEQLLENTFKVTSIANENNQITPVIVKKTGHYYVVSALNDNSLLTQNALRDASIKVAILSPQGKIIEVHNQSNIMPDTNFFSLSAPQLTQILSADTQIVEKHLINDKMHRVVSSRIPNSNLRIVEARQKKETAILRGNLALFGSLFLGTCVLVGMLLNSLQKQLASIRTIQKQTEVSRQRYQAAVDSDHGGIWEMDIPNNSAYLSASLSSILGLPRQEHHLTISKFLNLFHPQQRNQFLATARRSHIQGEFEIDIHAAHAPIVLECRGRPSTRTDRDFKRVIVGVALDITEQQQAQARLKATEARLHNALSSMTDSFVVWDQSNRLVLWNVRFEDFFRFTPGQLQAGLDHVQVDYMAKAAIAQINVNAENNQLSEVQLLDGRWIRYIETPTIEGGHVSVGTDITEIRMREAELRENSTALKNTVDILKKSQDRIFELAEGYEQEKIRAEEANQSKTDFLASMSHELRTPLNAINGFSDIMKKEMFGPLGDPRYKEYISDILFSGQHLLALINDILDMSKIEAGKMTLNSEVIFMHEMIGQVVRIIRGRAEDAQLNLDVDVPEIREIEADPRAVKQILLNLLTNAIKFTPEEGTVGVELIEKKSGLIIKVRDSGIGISPENIDRLAKPFEQVVDTENKHKEGTGLGLALSKSLIELHGGTFKIESVLGSGTTVIFTLPNKPLISDAEDSNATDVTQEISRLAQDIAKVLGDEQIQQHAINQRILPTKMQRPAA